MPKSHLHFVCLALLIASSAMLAQQRPASPVPGDSKAVSMNTATHADSDRAILGKATGKLVVDGTASQTTTTIFVKSEVVTDASTHVNVISHGNSLVFTPQSRFQAMRNAYRLKSGGSKVATYTGLSAHLPDCFSVVPVRPDYMTLYEVNWNGSSAIVYARYQDVKINYWGDREPDPDQNPKAPDRNWVLKEGQTARVSDVASCKPLVDIFPHTIAPQVLGVIGTATAFVLPPIMWEIQEDHKQNLSSEGPGH